MVICSQVEENREEKDEEEEETQREEKNIEEISAEDIKEQHKEDVNKKEETKKEINGKDTLEEKKAQKVVSHIVLLIYEGNLLLRKKQQSYSVDAIGLKF